MCTRIPRDPNFQIYAQPAHSIFLFLYIQLIFFYFIFLFSNSSHKFSDCSEQALNYFDQKRKIYKSETEQERKKNHEIQSQRIRQKITRKMGLSGCCCLVKYLLILMNFVFWVSNFCHKYNDSTFKKAQIWL